MGMLANENDTDRDARRSCAESCYPLVEGIARRLARRLPGHVEVGDLISAGAIGLMEAIDRFDPTRGARFESFAELRIRGAMLDDLRAQDTVSRGLRQLSRALQLAARRLSGELGREPDHDELAHSVGLGVDELHERRRRLSCGTVPLTDLDSNDRRLARDDEPFDAAWRAELALRLKRGLAELPARHRQVVSLYYYNDLNLREIGAHLGVTESRACQLHREALSRLRAWMERTDLLAA